MTTYASGETSSNNEKHLNRYAELTDIQLEKSDCN